MSFSHYLLRQLNNFSIKYSFFGSIKNVLRSIKYFFLGKTDFAWVIDEIKKARNLDNPIRMAFDVGAAVGDKTYLLLKSYPGAVIYSFEPQKKSLQELKKRLRLYRNRVKIFDIGFLDRNDQVLLQLNSYRDSSSLLPMTKYMENERMKKTGEQYIQVMPLDDFVKKENIEHIDLIKIDVEGVEKEVLEGGRETFKNKIDNVFIEISPLRKSPGSKDVADIFQFFYETGFSFIGCYGDYFFSKDKNLLKKYYG